MKIRFVLNPLWIVFLEFMLSIFCFYYKRYEPSQFIDDLEGRLLALRRRGKAPRHTVVLLWL